MISKLLVVSLSVTLLGAAAPSAKAKADFERGERALAQNQLADAEKAYRAAIQSSPGYAEALNGLGSALFKQNKRDEAVAQFKAAIQADAEFPLAYFNLGYAARKMGDFATAAQAYETYTRLKADDPDGFYGLGESYRQLGKPKEAIAAFEQYIQREKRPSEGKWVERAKTTVAELKEQVAKAPPAAATPATPTAPGSSAGTTPPATATAPGQQQQQQPQQQQPPQPAAVAPAPAPAANQPELARKKIAEGDGFMQNKQYREASFAYQDAVNVWPNNVEALFKLGNSYAVLGYYAQAIEKWNKVAELSPDPAVKKSAQDNVARAQQKMAQAGGSSPQAAGKAPGSGPVAPNSRAQARASYEQGVKLISSRDYNGALRSLTQAIQLEPSLAVAYVARGSAYIGLRRYAEAAADYQYANRLEPNLSSPLYGMAEAYRALGRNADARQYYEQYAQSSASDVRPDLQAQARDKAASLR